MQKRNLFLIALAILGTTAGLVWAADHIDAPGVTGTSTDITDFYAFQSEETTDNMVFVASLSGLMSPDATADAAFDEDVMVEFNIDNDGDAVEDLVIQAIFKDGVMQVYGPIAPSASGTTSAVEQGGQLVEVDITSYTEDAIIGTANGMKVFAGPRDDPFFMDFSTFQEILAGQATGFNNPGADTFAGTNVMSVVIEVPKSMLGSAATLNTWVEAKRKI